MIELLPSTGAFIGRVNGRDPNAFLQVAGLLDAHAYEFMMYETFYDRVDPIVDDYLATGFSFPVFHAEKRIGELIGLGGKEELSEALRRFSVNCRAACRLGARKLVLHLWNGVVSDHYFEHQAVIYPRLLAEAREHGLLLTVENVVCAVGDPLSRFYELLAIDPTSAFTYDTKMAAHHCQEYEIFSPSHCALFGEDARIQHVHFNDYGGVPGDFSGLATLHLGEGHLDLARIARELLAAGYRGTVTLECGCMRPDGSLCPEKMNSSLKTARSLFAPAVGKE